MMPDRSEGSVRKALQPFHDALYRVIEGGIDGFKSEITPKGQHVISKLRRAKATTLWAFIMNRAEEVLGTIPGIMAHKKYESTTYEMSQVEARLKKLTPAGFSRNYPTKRALEFVGVGSVQYELIPAMWSAPIRVDVGYVLDKLGQSLETVLVVCRRGGTIEWSYAIPKPAESVAVLPLRPAQPSRPVRVVAKRRKSPAKPKTGTEGTE